jgi:hypothetical protein
MENPRKNTGKSRKIMGFDGLWVMDDLSSWWYLAIWYVQKFVLKSWIK